jgi:Protein of unknown function (DUF2568)
MRPVNDGVRFLLELGLLASLAYWGWNEGGSVTRWLFAIGAPVLAAVAWGRFLAPKSSSRLSDRWRLLVEVILFGSATAALISAGQEWWGIVFGGLVGFHLVLTFVLDQR